MKILLLVCALWSSIYIDPSDGATKVIGDCKEGDYMAVIVKCNGDCAFSSSATVRFATGGNVDIFGRKGSSSAKNSDCEASDCFCSGTASSNFQDFCTRRNPSVVLGDTVNFVLKCVGASRNVRLILNGNDASISKDNSADPARIVVGNMTAKESKFFIFKCEPKCTDVKSIYATFDRGGDVDLVGAITSHIMKLSECTDNLCFCQGYADGGMKEKCEMRDGIDIKEETALYITVYAQAKSDNVTLIFNSTKSPSIKEPATVGEVEVDDEMSTDDKQDFEFTCNGKCDTSLLFATFDKESGATVNVFARDDAKLGSSGDGCNTDKCFCKGEKGTRPEYCPIPSGDRKSTFQVRVLAKGLSKNVKLLYKISNFVSVKKI